ncbi:hypothetical protein [Spiroplasma endosymbiont of Glossina fuscipes fuscipes]|uniref:hypothetical protein n=1 Tax=Spiroplasma endosymbiont of Glossina fuscipes fuscipes TaxID=2004463 RepID=UPI003CEDACDA
MAAMVIKEAKLNPITINKIYFWVRSANLPAGALNKNRKKYVRRIPTTTTIIGIIFKASCIKVTKTLKPDWYI